jgi:hypothetical protein
MKYFFFFSEKNKKEKYLIPYFLFATGTNPLLEGRFFGGGQNIKKNGVFAAARLDVRPSSFYFIFIFSLLF